jgi:hypothetical protein
LITRRVSTDKKHFCFGPWRSLTEFPNSNLAPPSFSNSKLASPSHGSGHGFEPSRSTELQPNAHSVVPASQEAEAGALLELRS